MNRNVHGYDIKFEPVTEGQICEFIDQASEADNLLMDAVGKYRYGNFENLNAEIIEEITQISKTITDFCKRLKNGSIKLYTPVYIPHKDKYYELHYFAGRKDQGSFYIKTELKLSDFSNEDDFLQALVNAGLLTKEKEDSICSIDEIDVETYLYKRPDNTKVIKMYAY